LVDYKDFIFIFSFVIEKKEKKASLQFFQRGRLEIYNIKIFKLCSLSLIFDLKIKNLKDKYPVWPLLGAFIKKD